MFVGIQFAERRTCFRVGNEGHGRDGDFIECLMSSVGRGGPRREVVLLLVGGSHRRYTQKNDYGHASHLFPLPASPDRPYAGDYPISTVPGNPRPQVLWRLGRALGPFACLPSNDGQRSHLVSRGLGWRSAFAGRTAAPPALRTALGAVICFDDHAR